MTRLSGGWRNDSFPVEGREVRARLFWALILDLAVPGVAYAVLVLNGVDPFLSAFGLLIAVAPLVHWVIGRLMRVSDRKPRGEGGR